MQIRLTVVDPLGPPAQPRGRLASCDVLVTAPAGTALAAVASALASAVSADAAASQPERSRESGGPIVLYAGVERLDTQRCTLGEPPLTDGAVLSLGTPAEPEAHPELDDAPTQLHVVAGPDAGGVHLLHGGQIHIGRSADADVPLDDPDVSRLHCAVTVDPGGRVSVADLGSTNGTTLAGTRVGTRPVRFAPGALLRIGESALRLTPSGGSGARAETAPDGEGHVRVSPGNPAAPRSEPLVVPGQGSAPSIEHRVVHDGGDTHAGRFGVFGEALEDGDTEDAFSARTTTSRIPTDDDSGDHDGRKGTPLRGTDVPPGVRRRGGIGKWARRLTGGRGEPTAEDSESAYGSAYGGSYDEEGADESVPPPPVVPQQPDTWPDPAALLLTALGPGPRLWERAPGHPEALTVRLGTADRATPDGSALLPAVPVTSGLREVGALGLAGPRARLSGLARAVVAQLAALHSPDALEIVLISTDRARTVAERTAEWSWLGWLPHLRPGHGQDCRLLLAYDREQATARTDELLRRLEDHAADTHGTGRPTVTSGASGRRTPGIGAQRGSTEGQSGMSSQPGVSSQLGSAEGQLGTGTARHAADDRRQRGATTTYSTSDDAHHHRSGTSDPSGAFDDPASGATRPRPADTEPADQVRGAAHRPSWARTDDGDGSVDGFVGPYTVLVVDGDPGGADVREAVARLAHDGPRAGIHVVCLAETEPASPASPVTETYEAACAAAPTFRECGAVGLLSGDVATALRVLRVAHGGTGASRLGTEASRPDQTDSGPSASGPVGQGTVAAVDAVSLAWAERFARALAPLRADGPAGERHTRVSAPLPQSARLLDELGLARATPASLLTRWADAGDDKDALGGRAWAVLGAGPRGPVTADLAAEGPHLLIEGPPGSGRTELLRAVVASLAAAERPDRLGIVLMDGRDSVGASGGHGEGLRVCTDVPHVTTHLTANDPVRMREFAQSLSSELKRRAELLGRIGFAEWHSRHEMSGRIISQRGTSGAGDLESPPSATIRLRPSAAARQQTEAAPPLPRLVVVVDDLDALVKPPLGSPGRPAAGSVIRALEAVAREGERLGVHLVAAAALDARTSETEPARHATLRVTLDATTQGPDEPAPGRGRLTLPDGRATPFQGGRVTGRIPRTATLRPTVVPLEWQRMGDPPARRPVRELGNGPTDLALLASALERATRSVSAAEVPSLL
ncbi:FHA domain-containing protein [Streptomyces xylophagus]|uniref:FHA domain-containing protein n=1 Tax=Streptomyces xylophagus TaxID=285514 RepID=UPI0005BA3229|nr:FHA domain-containing protein [Streptomyces xylophagus]